MQLNIYVEIEESLKENQLDIIEEIEPYDNDDCVTGTGSNKKRPHSVSDNDQSANNNE
jgi:hypothetical protein